MGELLGHEHCSAPDGQDGQQRLSVELNRFIAPAMTIDTASRSRSSSLLVIQRVDGWALYGLDSPDAEASRGILVPNNSMILLARRVLDLAAGASE